MELHRRPKERGDLNYDAFNLLLAHAQRASAATERNVNGGWRQCNDAHHVATHYLITLGNGFSSTRAFEDYLFAMEPLACPACGGTDLEADDDPIYGQTIRCDDCGERSVDPR